MERRDWLNGTTSSPPLSQRGRGQDRDTVVHEVVHEVAHHFGIDDARLAEMEL